jgi:hypothetical protein
MRQTWPDEEHNDEFYDQEYYDEDYYYGERPRTSGSNPIIIGGVIGALVVCSCISCLIGTAFGTLVLGGAGEESPVIAEATAAARSPQPPVAEGAVPSAEAEAPAPADASAPADAPMPVATPAANFPQLQILSHQSYVDESGWFHIVGEVQNSSGTPMSFVEVVATLYDDAGNVVRTDSTYVELETIPPGGKAPFRVSTDQYVGVTQYKLQAQGNPGTPPRQDLVVLSHNSYTDDAGWLHVQGEVQNTGETPSQFVKVVVTLYDVAGNVVGAGFTYTELDVIPPGGTSPFETETDHYPSFDHYEIQVQGQ